MKCFFSVLVALFFSVNLLAQSTTLIRESAIIPDFLYSNKVYDAQQFLQTKQAHGFAETAKYREKLFSKLYLKQAFSEKLADSFANQIPYTHIQNQAFYELANYYFKHEDFEAAYENFSKVDNALLTNREIAEKNFLLGYTALTLGQDSLAHVLFSSVKNIVNQYTKPDNYYYALLEYFIKNYDTAYGRFSLIENEPKYKNVVPFYLTEIKYLKNEKKEALSLALRYLKDSSRKLYYINEMHQLVGQIYFEQMHFEKAQPYLEYYIQNSAKIRREDIFELGYAYFQTGKIDLAAKELSKLYEKDDYLSELSLYILGDCYLKSQKKELARTAFKESATKNVSKLVNENARFLYTKLSYELGYDDEALNGSYNLVKKFPETRFKETALKILSDLIVHSSNYDVALKIINELNNNEALVQAHQKVAFHKGVAMFQDKNYREAIDAFNESVVFAGDSSMKAAARFWIAESYYKLGDLSKAIVYAKSFLQNPTQEGSANKDNASTLLAYAYVRSNKPEEARPFIQSILKSNLQKPNLGEDQQSILSKILYDVNKSENALSDSILHAYSISLSEANLARAQLIAIQTGLIEGGNLHNLYYTALGNAHLYANDTASAIQAYRQVLSLKNDRYRNEAYYRLADIFYQQKQADSCQNYLTQIMQSHQLFDEFVAQAFFLQAAIQESNNDFLNAASNLKMVVDQCESSRYVELALDRLRQLNKKANKEFGIINSKQ